MARERKRDARYDLRGGVNTAFAEDLLDGGELRRAYNARIANGVASLRAGSRRMHTNALVVPQGAALWTAPTAGRQIVTIAQGQLYRKPDAGATFTAVGVSPQFNTTDVMRVAPFRVGADLRLFIACGNQLRYFDGVNTLNAPGSGPTDAVDVAVYKGRVYAVQRDSKTLYASKVSDGTQFSTGGGGLLEDVETYDSEPLVGLVVCGSSLILAKEDSLSRLTGISTHDIRIDRNSDGLSGEVGCIARATLIGLEQAFFFLSDRGPYLGNESSVEHIGLKVDKEFDFENRAVWTQASAVHHKGRHEIWLTTPGDPTNLNAYALWIYDYRNRKWDGPWQRPTPTPFLALAPYERANGQETVMSCTSQYVVEEDIPNVYIDELERDGTGGNPLSLEVVYPQLMFGDPTREKSMRGVKQHLQANIEPGTSLTVSWASERGSGSTTIPSQGYGMRDYKFRLPARGKRITVKITSEPGRFAEIGGAVFDASLGARATRSPAAEVGANQSGSPNVLRVVPAQFTLAAGEVLQLQVVGLDPHGVEVPLGVVEWESSDPTKATVSATGLVTRVAAGSVTITATLGVLTGQSFGTLI